MSQPPPRGGRPAWSPLDAYLRQINETPLLSAEEERALAERVRDGDAAARDHLARANLRLVVHLACGYRRRRLALEDLIAEGNVGLLHAVEKFDPALGLRFSTYACYWVKQALQRAAINAGRTVRVPFSAAVLLLKWRRETARLLGELGRDPSPEEVAARLRLPRKKLRIVLKALRAYHAQAQGGPGSLAPVLEELIADGGAGPDARLSGAEQHSQLLGLLDRLDAREAAVLRLRFGLDDGQPRTLQEVGDRLGLSGERARQIERDALLNLRRRLGAA